jgi:predicted metal-dependent hydrolase
LRANRFDSENSVLYVGGAPDMFERRVRDYVKSEFLKQLKKMVQAAPREFWPRRIAIRDTTSRWGSCSSTGTMSFSWRLAFAPLDVMRYVVMHELAHKKHMDHSKEFWATVRELYGFGVERAKRWLTKNGGELYRYF